MSDETERKISPEFLIEDYTSCVNMFYREGGKYYFVHRSFQEYFCALSFTKQLEEDLSNILNVFDDREHSHGEMVLPFLCDMIPEKMERFVFLPYLQKLVESSEAYSYPGHISGYWDFLWSIYTVFDCISGYAEIPHFLSGPLDYLYSFITYYYDIDTDLSTTFFPYYKQFVVDILKCHNKDGEDFLQVISKDDPEFILPDTPENDPEYQSGTISYIMQIEIPEIVSYPDKYSTLFHIMDRDDFPLKIEYEAIKKLIKTIEEKLARANDEKHKVPIRVI